MTSGNTTPSQRARELFAAEVLETGAAIDAADIILGEALRDNEAAALRAIDTALAQGRDDERAAVAKWLAGVYSLHPLQLKRMIENGDHISGGGDAP